jgi:hypothetical protein
MVRIAALVVMIAGALAAAPASAQFNIFGDPPPPRPPQDIPNGSFPPQPPAPYPGPGAQQPYPAPGAGAPPPYSAAPPRGLAPPPGSSAIQAEPLPPPPGVGVAPVLGPAQQRPGERARAVGPPPGGAPPAAADNNAPAPPEGAEPPPTQDTVIEKPTEHIDNGRAVFSGLDKITGRTFAFDAAIGETVRFGALEVTPRACYTRPPTEATNTDAFVEVDEVTLKGEIKRIFTGWMYAASPGLHAVEHPIYDVWLTNCAAPVQTSQAEPAAAPPPAAAAPARSRRPAPAPPQQRTNRQPTRPLAGALPGQPQPQ